MKNLIPILTLLFSLSTTALLAQQGQNIRGQIIDADSEMTLIGATVEVMTIEPTVGAISDIDGNFVLNNLPIGRHMLRVSYLGYESITVPNVVLTSGKEVVMDFKLEESLNQLAEVVVIAETEKDQSINELLAISSKTFSMEEVNRYSGGRSDVSRLVSNFAGVATADDSRNDIVIRGNSPSGVLWRLEGVPIPNPNHFATLGTTGGPVSALNPNLLKNSDFITSAFPSEYGNALSGVFDVGFRSGNKQKYEVTAQLGIFSGLEAMVEGPLNKKKTSSFLVSYRHSFATIAQEIGVDIGTNATPNYRDLSFKFDLDAGKAGRFALFGIGATSDIEFIGAELGDDDLFADPNSDSEAESLIAIAGIKHNKLINDNSYVRTTFSLSQAHNKFKIENFTDSERTSKYDTIRVDDTVDRIVLTSYYNQKHSASWTTRIGVTLEQTMLNSLFDVRDGAMQMDTGLRSLVRYRDVDGSQFLIQPFMHVKAKLSTDWTLNVGLHGQFLKQNSTAMLEPRMALNYKSNEKSKWSLGYGLHSQTIPLPIYYYQTQLADGSYELQNQDLKFSKAHHLVLGHDFKFKPDWRVKAEIYYQYLFDIPVESNPSSFSLLNAGAEFTFPRVDNLVNDGTGSNYGLELTLEKFFSQGFYGLMTGSLFQSKYKGSDDISRNTAFNNQYVVNLLAGKEFPMGKAKRNSFSVDFKLTSAGGRFYTPVDLPASQAIGMEVRDQSNAYSENYDPYFRLDLKFGFVLNSKKRKFSQRFYIDLQNLTNNENVFTKRYNSRTNDLNTVLQSGFFPDLLYRIQF